MNSKSCKRAIQIGSTPCSLWTNLRMVGPVSPTCVITYRATVEMRLCACGKGYTGHVSGQVIRDHVKSPSENVKIYICGGFKCAFTTGLTRALVTHRSTWPSESHCGRKGRHEARSARWYPQGTGLYRTASCVTFLVTDEAHPHYTPQVFKF